MVAKHVNKKNVGKPRVLAINVFLHSLSHSIVSEAIRGRPGYMIYYKLDKYKEIRLYISIYILQ